MVSIYTAGQDDAEDVVNQFPTPPAIAIFDVQPHLLKEGLQTASWPESGSPVPDVLHLVALIRLLLHWLLCIAWLLLLLLNRSHSSWTSRSCCCLPVSGCPCSRTSRTWTVSAQDVTAPCISHYLALL